MSDSNPSANLEEAITVVLRAANELGVGLDEEEAIAWISAISAETQGSLAVEVDSGVYGQRIALTDHDPEGIARIRYIATIAGLPDRPPDVVTALALSGSSAEEEMHQFPVAYDFFERVHILAGSRANACATLGELIREKALSSMTGPGYRLREIKFGIWHTAGTTGNAAFQIGTPIGWSAGQVETGKIEYRTHEGAVSVLTWAEAAREPGGCRLDWLVADPEHGGVANASNALDATWEAPDGTITPLDGFLDPYFQEVYLETDNIPLFTKMVDDVGADSVAEYVDRLTTEVHKYTVEEPNHGKAARRLYNIFRLTGRDSEATHIRGLFDEPATALYQVSALLNTLRQAADSHATLEIEAIVTQVDRLIMSAVAAFDGRTEAEIVDRLLRLRDSVDRRSESPERADQVIAAQQEAMTAVDQYFKRGLTALPAIEEYLASVASHST